MDKLLQKRGNSLLEIREPNPTRNTNPITKDAYLRINIRYRDHDNAYGRCVIWTVHDVQGKTKLRDLFALHCLKGGPQPHMHIHNRIFLQQMDQRLKQGDGTEKYCWGVHGHERVMDLNWIFEDNEVWLSCSVDI